METTSTEDTWSFRLLVLLLFVIILFIGVVSAYYIVANTNWDAMDKNLAVTTKFFYIYTVFLGVCLLGALTWLVVDERRIRRLRHMLEKEKASS
jgi:uncharacterized integral membrane protein